MMKSTEAPTTVYEMDKKVLDNMAYVYSAFGIALSTEINKTTAVLDENNEVVADLDAIKENTVLFSFKLANGVTCNVTASWLEKECQGKSYDYVRVAKACRTGLKERIAKRFGFGETLDNMTVEF